MWARIHAWDYMVVSSETIAKKLCELLRVLLLT
jgi:hypothetical protein